MNSFYSVWGLSQNSLAKLPTIEQGARPYCRPPRHVVLLRRVFCAATRAAHTSAVLSDTILCATHSGVYPLYPLYLCTQCLLFYSSVRLLKHVKVMAGGCLLWRQMKLSWILQTHFEKIVSSEWGIWFASANIYRRTAWHRKEKEMNKFV